MFFDEYDLPPDGLSRPEIKKVYKDISTGTFTYGKTIELMNVISMEINNEELNDINSDALKSLWNKKCTWTDAPEYKSGTKYLFNGTFFQKYENGRLLWETDIHAGIDCRYIIIPDEGILAAGNTGNSVPHVVLMDDHGNIRWEYSGESVMSSLSPAFSKDMIYIAGHNYQEDKTGLNILCLDLNGNLVSEKKNTFDGYIMIRKLAVNGDRYVALAFRDGEKAILELSFEDKPAEKIIFKPNGSDCVIKDFLYHDGKLYVSALFLNESEDTFYSEKFRPLYKKAQAAYEAESSAADSENPDLGQGGEYKDISVKMKKVFREQYKSSLLLIDGSDPVRSVYTFKGGYCGGLSYAGEGQLVWQIFRIDRVRPALPPASFCSAYIYSAEFEFRFGNGFLLNKSKVGNDVEGDVSLSQ